MTEQNMADQLDGSVLGETIEDDDMPGTTNYPPERPLGAEDPTLMSEGPGTEDDLITRAWRETNDASATDSPDALDPTSDPASRR